MSQGWAGEERRVTGVFDPDWHRHKEKIIEDSKEIKATVTKVIDTVNDIRIAQAEMRLELRSVVSRGSFVTSSITSILVTVIGGLIMSYLVEKG